MMNQVRPPAHWFVLWRYNITTKSPFWSSILIRSNWAMNKRLGSLGYMGGLYYSIPSCIGIAIKHYEDPYLNNQYKVRRFYFRGSFGLPSCSDYKFSTYSSKWIYLSGRLEIHPFTKTQVFTWSPVLVDKLSSLLGVLRSTWMIFWLVKLQPPPP